jgi:hypothetical protein
MEKVMEKVMENRTKDLAASRTQMWAMFESAARA